jgi:hypothetical protein
MVQTVAKSTAPEPYTVLRPICIGGERVEAGTVVMLTAVVGSELRAANKVAPGGELPSEDKPATKPARGRAADKPQAEAAPAA